MKLFIERIDKENLIAGALIILGGLISFSMVVFADTASTSVTVGNSAPTISNLSFNAGNNLTLTENTFKWASTTLTVTDNNGCNTITSVVAKFYLASTSNKGTFCSYNGNNCYTTQGSCVATTTGNTCTGGADTSVQYDCGFKVWYIANPTASGAPTWASSIWSVSATTTDGTATANATNTSQTIEVNTLNSLNVTGSIGYGSVSPGSNTGASNQSVTHTNTGNTPIDNEISGDDVCTDYPTCSGDTIDQAQQKFDTSDVTYSSLTNSLSATPVSIELTLPKPTATTSAVTTTTYWGTAVPGGQATGSYTGQNTFSAVAD